MVKPYEQTSICLISPWLTWRDKIAVLHVSQTWRLASLASDSALLVFPLWTELRISIRNMSTVRLWYVFDHYRHHSQNPHSVKMLQTMVHHILMRPDQDHVWATYIHWNYWSRSPGLLHWVCQHMPRQYLHTLTPLIYHCGFHHLFLVIQERYPDHHIAQVRGPYVKDYIRTVTRNNNIFWLTHVAQFWEAAIHAGTSGRLSYYHLDRLSDLFDPYYFDALVGRLHRIGAICNDPPWQDEELFLVPSCVRYMIGILEYHKIWPEWTSYARDKVGGYNFYKRSG